MKKLQFYLVFLFLVFAVSCEKDTPEPSPKEPAVNEPPWKKFVGTYQVKNLNTDEAYEMHIGHKQDTLENGYVTDSLVVTNFDNNFNYNYVFKNFLNDKNYLEIAGFYGIRDKNNNRWAIYSAFDDTTTNLKENTLVNDTIIFYIRKSNIAFWQPDGTWYYDCYCKHLAVKVSDD